MTEIKSKYEWHVLYITNEEMKRQRHAPARNWEIVEFDNAEDAADKLFALWDEGYEDAHIIPVFKG